MSNWLNYDSTCELCERGFSVLSGRLIIKLSNICFLGTYVDQMIIQQRFDVLLNLQSYNILLMFFSLFLKAFTNILKIYNYLKYIHGKIPKYSQAHVLTIIICQDNSVPQLCVAFELYPSELYWKLVLKQKGLFWQIIKNYLKHLKKSNRTAS